MLPKELQKGLMKNGAEGFVLENGKWWKVRYNEGGYTKLWELNFRDMAERAVNMPPEQAKRLWAKMRKHPPPYHI